MDNYQKDLESMGFSKNKAAIYYYVTKHPGVTAGTLISKLKLQRSVVYVNLSELESDKLVYSVKQSGAVTAFYPAPANQLVAQQESKLLIAEKLSRDFSRMNLSYSSDEVFVYHGADAISYVCDQHFVGTPPNEVLFMGSSKYGDQSQLGGYWNQYHKKRIAKNIPTRILYDRETDSNILIKRNGLKLCTAKYMPFGMTLPMWYCIWGDYIAMFVPGDHVAYIIKNKSAVTGMQQYFDFLWEQGSKYKNVKK